MDESLFRDATLGPGRIAHGLLPDIAATLMDVPRLIYLDCDLLVFRDLSELFDLNCRGKVIAAVRDSETLIAQRMIRMIASAMNLPAEGTYFNSGVML